jgi:hypothetical protein
MMESIIDVEIKPSATALSRLGVTETDFAAGLNAALDSLANCPREELPRPSDIPIWIQGKQQRLGDMAAIRVRVN